MIYVLFGDDLLLSSTLLHSGHYGSRNNLRFHGILSTDPWTTKTLGYLNDYMDIVYNVNHKEINMIYGHPYIIDKLCPLCFSKTDEDGNCVRNNACKMRSGRDIGMNALSGK